MRFVKERHVDRRRAELSSWVDELQVTSSGAGDRPTRLGRRARSTSSRSPVQVLATERLDWVEELHVISSHAGGRPTRLCRRPEQTSLVDEPTSPIQAFATDRLDRVDELDRRAPRRQFRRWRPTDYRVDELGRRAPRHEFRRFRLTD